MGVRGLQSFIKENRQSLCRTLILDGSTRVPVVVDGLGLVFQLYFDALPWAAGGEYRWFYDLSRRLIRAWRGVGLEPVFVFDGAIPPSKHTTVLNRMQNTLATTRMFYAISPTTRSSPSHNDAILPTFTSLAFHAALLAESVTTHFAPAGEADGLCVSLARENDGYVLGQDTDFMIFNGKYAPFDMMEWIPPPESETPNSSDDFTTVSKPKTKKQRQSNLLPPGDGEGCRLVLATYSSELLAKRLRLPITLLPLLASLVGNDYSPKRANDLFFPGVRASDRVERVARVLRDLKARSGPDAAVDLVRRATQQLSRIHLDQTSLDNLVDGLIDATMEYLLPGANCCTTYPFCGECNPSPPSAAAYADAQKLGFGNHVAHAYLHPDRIYLHTVLEDPGVPSVRSSEAAVEARRAAYIILDNEIGLRFPTSPEEEEELEQDAEASALTDEQNDEAQTSAVQGVADAASDATVETEADETTEPEPESEPEPEPQPEQPIIRTITEYGRHGGSISSRSIPLPDRKDTSIAKEPLETRLKTYLSLLNCDSASTLPVHIQPLIAALRIAISSGGWRRVEVEAILKGCIGSVEAWREAEANGTDTYSDERVYPLLTSVNSQRVAQLIGALFDLQPLGQALLLLPGEGEEVTHLTPYVFVCGTALHYLLSGAEPPEHVWKWKAEWGSMYKAALGVVLDGMEVEEGGRKKKKAVKQTKEVKVKNGSTLSGRFALLEMESA